MPVSMSPMDRRIPTFGPSVIFYREKTPKLFDISKGDYNRK